MKKIPILIIICLGMLSIISINEASASTVAKLVVCNNDATLCPNTNMTISFPIITTGIVSTMHFGDCANNQVLVYQSSNQTWICGTNGGVDTDNFLTSINSDTTAAQTISGQSTNITISDSGATHTFKLGTNIPVLSGAAQRFSNTLTIQDPIINGLDIARVDKSIAYTATIFDNVINVNVTACGSPCQITLPTASSDTNGTYWIKKVDYGRNILSIKGGGSIDGFTWFNMTNAKDAVQLQSNSTGWNVLESSALDFNAYHVKGTVNNRWYGTETIEATNATFSGTAGHIYATQLILPKPVKIDQIRIGVTTLGASSLCRVGIYSDNGTAYPNSIVSGSDVGTLTTSTLGIKSNTFTGSGITLNGGLYWLAMNCQATMPSLAGVPAGSFDSVLGMGNARMGGQQIGTGYDATLAFGALPTAYPSGAAITIAGTEPMIQIRIIG